MLSCRHKLEEEETTIPTPELRAIPNTQGNHIGDTQPFDELTEDNVQTHDTIEVYDKQSKLVNVERKRQVCNLDSISDGGRSAPLTEPDRETKHF